MQEEDTEFTTLSKKVEQLNDTIQDLTEQVKKLTLLLDSKNDNTSRSDNEVSHNIDHTVSVDTNESASRGTKRISVGDRVTVTNNYKGRKGTEGTVVKKTAFFVTVKSENSEDTFRVSIQNIKKKIEN